MGHAPPTQKSDNSDENSESPTCNVIINTKIWCPLVRPFTIAQPIRGIQLGADKSVKRRIRPGMRAARVAMFDGIGMNVITQPHEFIFVADNMLPKAALPYRLLAFLLARSTLFDDVGWVSTHPTQRIEQSTSKERRKQQCKTRIIHQQCRRQYKIRSLGAESLSLAA